jgi:hypothetical protein
MPLDENPAPVPGEAAAPWPEIDRSLLEEARPPPEPFPLDLLPDTCRAWVEASAQAFTPVDYLAQGVLGAVAAVCGGGIVVRVTTSWGEPLLLWQALVGGPSSGKSPALDAARGLLDDLTVDAGGAGCHATPAVVPEASRRSVAAALSRSPPSVTLWFDELAESLAEALRDRERAGCLAGWRSGVAVSTQPLKVDLHEPILAMNVVGALQPDRLADALGEVEDGFAARFLYAWPEPTSCGALRDRPADDQAMRGLLQRIAAFAGAAAKPSALAFEPDAVAGLERFLPMLRQQMREADGVEAAWLGKGAGTVVRLAGLLTLMHWAETPTGEPPGGVSAQRREDALRLWAGYFHPHAKSVFERAGAGNRDRTARRAARWLRRAGLHQVSREDIRREALCQKVNAEGAEDIMARLEAGGVLRGVPVQINGRGRPLRRWEVNPIFRISR